MRTLRTRPRKLEEQIHDGAGFITHKRSDATTLEAHYFKGGKGMMPFKAFVTQDGRSLWITVKGTDPQGNRVEEVICLYEREHRCVDLPKGSLPSPIRYCQPSL